MVGLACCNIQLSSISNNVDTWTQFPGKDSSSGTDSSPWTHKTPDSWVYDNLLFTASNFLVVGGAVSMYLLQYCNAGLELKLLILKQQGQYKFWGQNVVSQWFPVHSAIWHITVTQIVKFCTIHCIVNKPYWLLHDKLLELLCTAQGTWDCTTSHLMFSNVPYGKFYLGFWLHKLTSVYSHHSLGHSKPVFIVQAGVSCTCILSPGVWATWSTDCLDEQEEPSSGFPARQPTWGAGLSENILRLTWNHLKCPNTI